MARCGCTGSTCGCKIQAGSGVEVTGTGTAQDPFVVSLDGLSIEDILLVEDTPSVKLTLLGNGTLLDPFVLSAEVQVGETVVSTPTNGGTTTIDPEESAHVFGHESTIAAHTIELPDDSTALRKEITFFTDEEITSLTVTGDGTTVVGAPSTLGAGNSFTMRLIGTTWRCVGVAWAS